MEKIHVIGLGPGMQPLPPELRERIYAADILVGGSRLLSLCKDFSGEVLTLKGDLKAVAERIREEAMGGMQVVVLADGDPLFFGIGKRLLRHLGEDCLEFHPGVTTVQAAASRLKIPWESVKTVSLHGRHDMAPLLRAICFHPVVGVYTGGAEGPARIARALRSRGIQNSSMTVLEDLGAGTERVRQLPLEEVEGEHFSALNFVVLRRSADPEVPLGLGIDEELYAHDRGMITKKEIRAVGLCRLRILPFHTVWDVGAGCGSVAVEASALTREGRVFAVERDEKRVRDIKANVRRTGAAHVEVVHGEAPGCLSGLPDPDRVFVGGGLGRGLEVLEEVCRRLQGGGRLVAHTVLMGSLARCLSYLQDLGWTYEVAQIQVSRSCSAAGDIRMQSLNPVFIVSADKP